MQLQVFHPVKEEFVAAAKTWAKNLSFYLSKKKSDTHRVVMVCVRGGKKRVTGEATRTMKGAKLLIPRGVDTRILKLTGKAVVHYELLVLIQFLLPAQEMWLRFLMADMQILPCNVLLLLLLCMRQEGCRY